MSTLTESPPEVAGANASMPAAAAALLRTMATSTDPQTRLAALEALDPLAARRHRETLRQAKAAQDAIEAAKTREEKRAELEAFAQDAENESPGFMKRCVSAARAQRAAKDQGRGFFRVTQRPTAVCTHRATRTGRTTTARRTASHSSTTRSTSAGDAGGDCSGDSPGPGDGPHEARPTVGRTPAGVIA